MEHITLPVLDQEGTKVLTYEVLEVERESSHRVRLLHSPAWVSGIARGDVLELDANELAGFRVISRAGFVACVVAFASEEQRVEAEFSTRQDVLRLGGVCEGGPGRSLVFSLPVVAGFTEIEDFLNIVCATYPNAAWYFGNVYGTDGQVLNWWEPLH
jgi:hypothetical protein